MSNRIKVLLPLLGIGLGALIWLFPSASSVVVEDRADASSESLLAAQGQPGVLVRSAPSSVTIVESNEHVEAEGISNPDGLLEAGSLSGYVSDEKGQPLVGWQIYLEDSFYQKVVFDKTSKHGAYLLSDIPPGSYLIRAWNPRTQINRDLVADFIISPRIEVERNFRIPLGAGGIKGRIGMSEEIGNSISLQLILFSSKDPDNPLARLSSAIDWKVEALDGMRDTDPGENRVLNSNEGAFDFKSLPPDLYTLKVVFDESNGLVVEEIIEVGVNQIVDLGLSVYRLEDFFQAKLGYIPEWIVEVKKAIKKSGE